MVITFSLYDEGSSHRSKRIAGIDQIYAKIVSTDDINLDHGRGVRVIVGDSPCPVGPDEGRRGVGDVAGL